MRLLVGGALCHGHLPRHVTLSQGEDTPLHPPPITAGPRHRAPMAERLVTHKVSDAERFVIPKVFGFRPAISAHSDVWRPVPTGLPGPRRSSWVSIMALWPPGQAPRCPPGTALLSAGINNPNYGPI